MSLEAWGDEGDDFPYWTDDAVEEKLKEQLEELAGELFKICNFTMHSLLSELQNFRKDNPESMQILDDFIKAMEKERS